MMTKMEAFNKELFMQVETGDFDYSLLRRLLILNKNKIKNTPQKLENINLLRLFCT